MLISPPAFAQTTVDCTTMVTGACTTAIVAGAGANLTVIGNVTTTTNTPAVQATQGGKIMLPGPSTISTTSSGGSAWGLNAFQGAGTAITATDTVISTTGDNARAVRADAGGGGGNVPGNNDISINLLRDTIMTIGIGSPGIDADGRNTGAPTTITITATDTTITTTGGPSVTTPPFADLSTFIGVTSSAVRAQNGGQVALNGGSATTKGAFAAAIWIDDGGLVNARNYTVTAEGPGSPALQLISRTGLTCCTAVPGAPDTQIASFTNSTLTSMQAPAILNTSGTGMVTLTGSSVAGNGIWLDVTAAPTVAGVTLAPSILNLIADSSTLTGAALTQTGATSNVTLQNGTIWTMTGNSSLTSLTLVNGGTLAGTGTLSSVVNVNNGGVLSPGTPACPARQ